MDSGAGQNQAHDHKTMHSRESSMNPASRNEVSHRKKKGRPISRGGQSQINERSISRVLYLRGGDDYSSARLVAKPL